MQQTISSLRPRHFEIINLYFLGKKYREIAEIMGISTAAVSCIIRSPLAQAELSKLVAAAQEKVTDVPLRAQLHSQMERVAKHALNVEEAILDPRSKEIVDTKIRARVAMHALDRIVFNRDSDDEREGSYRDILRKLDEMSNTMMIKPQPVVIDQIPTETGNGGGCQQPAELSIVNGNRIVHDEIEE